MPVANRRLFCTFRRHWRVFRPIASNSNDEASLVRTPLRVAPGMEPSRPAEMIAEGKWQWRIRDSAMLAGKQTFEAVVRRE